MSFGAFRDLLALLAPVTSTSTFRRSMLGCDPRSEPRGAREGGARVQLSDWARSVCAMISFDGTVYTGALDPGPPPVEPEVGPMEQARAA